MVKCLNCGFEWKTINGLILYVLNVYGSVCATDIGGYLGLSQKNISHRLCLMKKEGFVKVSYKVNKKVMYCITKKGLDVLKFRNGKLFV